MREIYKRRKRETQKYTGREGLRNKELRRYEQKVEENRWREKNKYRYIIYKEILGDIRIDREIRKKKQGQKEIYTERYREK